MADMQDIKLNLAISAQDLTGEALNGVRSTLESLAGLASHIFENVAVAAYASVHSIEDDYRGLGQFIRDQLSGAASHAFEPMAVAGHEMIKGLKDDILGLRNEIEKDMKQAAESASRSLGEIRPPTPHGGGGGKGGHGGLFGIEGQMNTLYAGMSMGAAALPAIGFLKQSISAWSEYDHQMRLVNQEMNLSGQKFKETEGKVIALSNSTGIAASELAKGLYNIAATGGEMVKPEKALERLKLVTEAAKAGNSDLDTVTKALDSVMGAYGAKAGDATKILNQMFAATNNGQMRFGDLAKSVGASATSAAAAGVKYHELAAAQATLTNAGKNAEVASQNLNSLILGIAASSPKAKAEAEHLGIAWGKSGLEAKGLSGILEQVRTKVGGNTEELKKLFPNQRAYLTALLLTGKAHGQYVETLGKVKGAHDDLDKALKKTEGDTKESIDKMKTNVSNAGMQIAAALAPAITALANDVTQLAQWFQKLSPETKKVIGEVILGATAFLSFGSAMFMSISSIGAVISGVKEVGKAFGSLGKLKNLKLDFATKIYLQIAKVKDAIKGFNIGEKLVSAFSKVKGAIQALQIGERIAPILARLGTIGSGALRMIGVAIRFAMGPWGLIITAVVTGVVLIITHWNQIAAWVKQNFGVTLPTTLKQWEALFSNIWKNIVKAVSDAWNYIKPAVIGGVQEISKYWNEIWPQVKELFSEVWSVIKVLFTSYLSFMLSHWQNTWNTTKSVLKFVWDGIVSAFKIWWDVISGLFKVVLDLLTGHWDKAWKDMKQMLGNVWKDITGSFHKLVGDALNFGKNLVKMISDGINGGIHWVESAVSNVAQKIKDFLGFHSPTKEGPARTSDTWAPAFMRMFSKGIEDNQDLVQLAVAHTAQALKSGFHVSKMAHLIPAIKPIIEHQLLASVKPMSMIERPDPFLEADTKTYDWVQGHSAHHSHYTININVDGRSKKTDRELAEHVVSLIAKNIKTHR